MVNHSFLGIGNGAVGKMNISVAEVAIIIFSSFLINIQKR